MGLQVVLYSGGRLDVISGGGGSEQLLRLYPRLVRTRGQDLPISTVGSPDQQRERRVALSRDVVAYLRDLRIRSTHSQGGHPIFASRSGKPLSHRNATRRGFEPAAKRAGINGVTFHDMRHAFASRMISRGVDPVALAKLLGHQDARVTLARYTHEFDRVRTDDLVREAMAW